MGQARALLGLVDTSSIGALAEQVIKEGMSVRRVEETVRQLNLGPSEKKVEGVKAKARPVWLNELAENLVESIGAPVHNPSPFNSSSPTMATPPAPCALTWPPSCTRCPVAQ